MLIVNVLLCYAENVFVSPNYYIQQIVAINSGCSSTQLGRLALKICHGPRVKLIPGPGSTDHP